MRILVVYLAGVVVAVLIGLAAVAAADDTPTDCEFTGDQLGTVVCP